MKILIDDEKTQLPDGSMPDMILCTFDAAVAILLDDLAYNPEFDDIYIDHDLGSEKTGYDFMCILEEKLAGGENFGGSGWYKPRSITCVSNNPPGRARIQQVIDKLYGGKWRRFTINKKTGEITYK